MKVTLFELEQATTALFEHLRSNGLDSFEVDADICWDVRRGARYSDVCTEDDLVNLDFEDVVARVKHLGRASDVVKQDATAIARVLRWIDDRESYHRPR